MNSEGRPDSDLLAELLLQWEELYDRGQDTSADQLAKDRLDLVPELARRIKALRTVSWITKPTHSPSQEQSLSRTELAGRILGGRYRLDQLVAEGGFAEIYRAFDVELQRTVAVKIPKSNQLHSTKSFLAEARRVAGLEHDSIVTVYDVVVENDTCFIVSEFLEGGSLADRLEGRKPSAKEAIRWISEIADALQYAHEHGIVHRDVKPANVLIDQHERAKLADFGISQSSMSMGSCSPSLGTLRYMSPEQLGGKPTDHRSDIYSVGVVLYESLTGQLPYSSVDPRVLRREITAGLIQLPKPLPTPLVNVVRKATAHSPDLRHQSAKALANDLRKIGSQSLPLLTRFGTVSVLLILGAIALAASVFPNPFVIEQKEVRSPIAPHPPRNLDMADFGDSKVLEGTLPTAWQRPGVFAEITSAGTVRYPRLPFSQFVIELDIEIRNSHGRLNIVTGEPGSNVDMCLGDLWPQDAKQEKVACRLFRTEPTGVRWIGETHFPANTRMTLKLVVNDDMKAIIRDGLFVVGSSGDSSDLCLSFLSTDDTDATIYSAEVRPITPVDLEEARQVLFPHKLKSDRIASEARLSSQISDEWDSTPQPGRSATIRDIKLALRWIAPGEFVMGTTTEKLTETLDGGEKVVLTKGYWIGAYEVTQGQWISLLGTNTSRITGSPYLPVNGVSWSDACHFCKELTAREKTAGRCPEGYEYRLPTEAEWEFACRAGKDQEFSIPAADIPVRSPRFPTIVEAGASTPNAWGIYELLGNVPEWCLDMFVDYPKASGKPSENRFHAGDPSDSMFSVRGGSFWMFEVGTTCLARTRRHNLRGGFRGFRVVLGPEIKLHSKGLDSEE